MKIAVVCRSDSTGGAAVVSRRLTEAFREQGHDARMLVVEKKTGFPWVEKASYPLLKPLAFIAERLQIFLNNGFSRKTLWKTDTASFGLPLWRHPVIKGADMVVLNWVNQGMLSLRGVEKICRQGRKVVWTMHDMWNLTGVCHHAMECRRYEEECRNCPMMKTELAHRVWQRKKRLYEHTDINFVAVSNWLARKGRESSLLKNQKLTVIPNPYNIKEGMEGPEKGSAGSKKKILFSAASLDNWIKGLDTFREAIRILADRYPEKLRDAEVVMMGAVKNPASLEGFALPVRHLGMIRGEDAAAKVYADSDVIVSSSSFESFGMTLLEGQAYGAVPVAFDRGGQSDIISHLSTGYLAAWDESEAVRAANIAEGIAWALTQTAEIKERMRESASRRFSYREIANRYLQSIES